MPLSEEVARGSAIDDLMWERLAMERWHLIRTNNSNWTMRPLGALKYRKSALEDSTLTSGHKLSFLRSEDFPEKGVDAFGIFRWVLPKRPVADMRNVYLPKRDGRVGQFWGMVRNGELCLGTVSFGEDMGTRPGSTAHHYPYQVDVRIVCLTHILQTPGMTAQIVWEDLGDEILRYYKHHKAQYERAQGFATAVEGDMEALKKLRSG